MRTVWSDCLRFNIIFVFVRLAVFLVVISVLQVGSISVGHYCLFVTEREDDRKEREKASKRRAIEG